MNAKEDTECIGSIVEGSRMNSQARFQEQHLERQPCDEKENPIADMEIVAYPGSLVPRKYFSWQKIFGKVTTLKRKIDYNVK